MRAAGSPISQIVVTPSSHIRCHIALPNFFASLRPTHLPISRWYQKFVSRTSSHVCGGMYLTSVSLTWCHLLHMYWSSAGMWSSWLVNPWIHGLVTTMITLLLPAWTRVSLASDTQGRTGCCKELDTVVIVLAFSMVMTSKAPTPPSLTGQRAWRSHTVPLSLLFYIIA